MPRKPIVTATVSYTQTGVPFSAFHNDVYHSLDGGAAQTHAVFLAGNDLPGRWLRAHPETEQAPAFTIVEVGFGLGLNFLATVAAWHALDSAERRYRQLHFVSIESHPLGQTDLEKVHLQHPDLGQSLSDFAQALHTRWPPLSPGLHRLEFESWNVTLTLGFGEASELVPQLRLAWDALFLDGFNPNKNADAWDVPLLKGLARRAAPNATLATWAVSSAVRSALVAAGFVIEKKPGFGRKRERLQGHTRYARPPISPWRGSRTAVVLGAGMAGCAVTEALCQRGWTVTLVDRRSGPAQETSGNPSGAFHPHISVDDCHLSRLTRAGSAQLIALLRRLEAHSAEPLFSPCGHLQIAQGEIESEQDANTLKSNLHRPLEWVEQRLAQQLAGVPLSRGGVWFDAGGTVSPAALCRALVLAALETSSPPTLHWNRLVSRIERRDHAWRLLGEDGRLIAQADVLILANANQAPMMSGQTLELPHEVRGQITYVPTEIVAPPQCALTGTAYWLPPISPHEQNSVLGATYEPFDSDNTVRTDGHTQNLSHLGELLGRDLRDVDVQALSGRVGFRSVLKDRLPAIGAIGNETQGLNAWVPGGSRLDRVPRVEGLYGAYGFASRGLLWAALAASLLPDLLEGAPLCLEGDLVDAIDPARFLLQAIRNRHT